MALLPFDELNTPKVEVEPPEKYFSKMAISKEQKEERVETANDLMDVLLFFFALLAIEMESVNPNYDMVYRKFKKRFRDVVADHSRMDDYQNNYVDEYTLQQYDTTKRHMEAAGVGSDGRTDAGWWTSADRAMAIGENEANSILNYSELQKAIDEGYTTKTWVTERDNRVRKTHKEVDGVTIPIKEYFIVGNGVMLAPHDEYNNPDECVNCRCSLKFSKQNISNNIEKDLIREKAKAVNSVDDLKRVSSSSIIDMSSMEEIVNYFKNTYNIEVKDFDDDPEKLFANKAPLVGLDDMLNEFPEIKGRIKEVIRDKNYKEYGEFSKFGTIRIGNKGVKDYGTGVHEATHMLDYVRDPLQNTYAQNVLETARRNLQLRKNSKDYRNAIFLICGRTTKYLNDEHEIIAYCMETAKGGDQYAIANEVYRLIKEGL